MVLSAGMLKVRMVRKVLPILLGTTVLLITLRIIIEPLN